MLEIIGEGRCRAAGYAQSCFKGADGHASDSPICLEIALYCPNVSYTAGADPVSALTRLGGALLGRTTSARVIAALAGPTIIAFTVLFRTVFAVFPAAFAAL